MHRQHISLQLIVNSSRKEGKAHTVLVTHPAAPLHESAASVGLTCRTCPFVIFIMTTLIPSIGWTHRRNFMVYLNNWLIFSINELRPRTEKCGRGETIPGEYCGDLKTKILEPDCLGPYPDSQCLLVDLQQSRQPQSLLICKMGVILWQL